jgi:hypothetical protein
LSDLRKLVPKADEIRRPSADREAALAEFFGREKLLTDDETVLAIWPARTKSDLAIRRTRLRDCIGAYKAAGQLNIVHKWAKKLDYDIITLINLLNANFICCEEDEWLTVWDTLGAFDADLDHFTAVAKKVNDQLKKYPSDLPRHLYAEAGTMTGYRNLPYPGFVIVDEARKLAQGGAPHAISKDGKTPEEVFAIMVDRALECDPKPVPWLSFTDYVVDGEWETTGSSNIGRVEWKFDEDTGDFKARKNLVADVVDLRTHAAEALKTSGQKNWSLVKSELGKVRLAVAGDIYTYWKMSWLLRFVGHAYTQWPGSTIDETLTQQTDRIVRMVKALAHAFGLPFDYVAFDHQPTTAEIVQICAKLFSVGRRAVPMHGRAEYDAVVLNVLQSFGKATLIARTDSGDSEFVVEGGLGSGLRVTSIVGNAWNSVMTRIVADILTQLGVSEVLIANWIRGDDSAVITDTYLKALLFRLGYQAINAVGADGKFGILLAQMEFLRVWFTAHSTSGYVLRAVPGLQQRKPWSPNPWDDEATMLAVNESIRILRRRGGISHKIDLWWRASANVWSQRKHVSAYWLQVPRELGGLGVEQWDGRFVPSKPWPRVDTRSIEVTNRTGWRAAKVHKDYSPHFVLTDVEADNIAQRLVSAKVAGDDVPSIAAALRSHARVPDRVEWIRQEPYVSAKSVELVLAAGQALSLLPADVGAHAAALAAFRAPYWGDRRGSLVKWQQCVELAQERSVSARQLMEKVDSSFIYDLVTLERRGLSRTQAVGWLTGSLSFNQPKRIHSALNGILDQAVAVAVWPLVRRSNAAFATCGAAIHTRYEESLLRSALATTAYGW